MFVCTANTLNLPQPLLDRMEIIRLEGYTEDEKVEIAERHLVAKQVEAHGLKPGEFTLTPGRACASLIQHITRARRASARWSERSRKLCRKALRRILGGQGNQPSRSRPDNLHEYAGVAASIRHGLSETEDQIGAVTGLAWTEVGGELLTIESVTVRRQGRRQGDGQAGRRDEGIDRDRVQRS